MSKLLYIKANAKPEGISRTYKISDAFMECYREHHPEDEIIVLDLYQEGITFLSQEAVMMRFSNIEQTKEHPVYKYAYQFREADKYVFAEPLWNLGIPAILKAYMDYVCVTNVTFKYTAEGPVGLCSGKKALNITTRGGGYSSGTFAEYELGDRYLKTILTFLGVCDLTTIAAELLDVIGQDVDGLVEQAILEARELSEHF